MIGSVRSTCFKRLRLNRVFRSIGSEIEKRINQIPRDRIRNFCIIAHVDHGKSTLADRLIEHCSNEKVIHAQVLDKLIVERERGITVKAQSSSLLYKHGESDYLINLVDTPGHSDFAYEVERSLKACEGALLIVDASQGIQAQTFAHLTTARRFKVTERALFGSSKKDFEFLPVINKIDLPAADPDAVELQIAYTLNLETLPARISAKTGLGIENLLERIVETIPSPAVFDWGMSSPALLSNFRSFVFDSWFETNRGVFLMTRVFNGSVKGGDQVVLSTQPDKTIEVKEVGILAPHRLVVERLEAGQVGYVLVGIKDPRQSVQNLGCTILGKDPLVRIKVHQDFESTEEVLKVKSGSEVIKEDIVPVVDNWVSSIPSFQKSKQLVFCCLYPEDPEEFQQMDFAIHKLVLEDPGVGITVESSPALGTGYRCGFLGVFHMEIFRERLSTEYDIGTISTFPTVLYKAALPKGETRYVHNVLEAPERCTWEEPWVDAQILIKQEYEKEIKSLAEPRRGKYLSTKVMEDGQLLINYEFPMSEVITDFVNSIKATTRGYGSLDYNLKDYRPADVVKMVIFITDEPIDAMSFLVHKSKAFELGKKICQALREFIPTQLFDYNIQAKVGSKVIASEKVKGRNKNVIAKCYGGDYSRKRKLIENQKEGKKKMRMFGKVSMPAGAINSVFKKLK